MLTLLAAAAILVAADPGTDYFPLKPGLTWEYNVTVPGTPLRFRQVQKSIDPVKIGDTMTSPLDVSLDGREDNTTYYAISGGFVTIVAVTDKVALPTPIKVIPVEPKEGQKWEFEGETMLYGTVAPTKSSYKITEMKEQDVLGKTRMCVKIESKSKIGTGKKALETKAALVFAKGVGMIYRTQEVTSDRGGSATTTLVKFEGGD